MFSLGNSKSFRWHTSYRAVWYNHSNGTTRSWNILMNDLVSKTNQKQVDQRYWPGSPLQFPEGPAGHAKVPAEVPEDSWVLRTRCLWFPRFSSPQTWILPSGTTRSRQYYDSMMVWHNLPLYHLFYCLLPLVTLFLSEKTRQNTKTFNPADLTPLPFLIGIVFYKKNKQ